MRTVGIRELKNKLSAYLRDVRAGEIVLVTDRGRVIAEIRPPGPAPALRQALSPSHAALLRMIERGELSPGCPVAEVRDIYSDTGIRVPDGTAKELIDEQRDDSRTDTQ